MVVASLAKLEHMLRPALAHCLPAKSVVQLYSKSRPLFLSSFTRHRLLQAEPIPERHARTLWGKRFRAPLFNAAGLFKTGEGAELCYALGAGAFLAGTTTACARSGNSKEGIALPFSPYPSSHAASNWLGLPNPGDEVVAAILARLPRRDGFPIGASISATPALREDERLALLLKGLHHYEKAKVDFIELNESCPNTEERSSEFDALRTRLQLISTEFLRTRQQSIPLIVKLSTDTPLGLVPELLATLLALGFDGVNFGNTSTRYDLCLPDIEPKERALFHYFTTTFGGGVSGRPLRTRSLALVNAAARACKDLAPQREFHIIRTGGIENGDDVRASLDAGASLVQWYSGFFERFAQHGTQVYPHLFQSL